MRGITGFPAVLACLVGASVLSLASDGAALVNVGFLDTPFQARNVEVVDGLAYVADGQCCLRIIDVSDPAAPVELGFFDTPEAAYGVTVVGGLAYLAVDKLGLRIIDVSDPSAPIELAELP